jgi:acyl-coenzyme A synthetase/AMP-(fatty) acid ligase
MQDLAEILGKSPVTAGKLRNVCVVPAIPRNENGKISRAEVNAALLTLSPVQLPPRKSRY